MWVNIIKSASHVARYYSSVIIALFGFSISYIIISRGYWAILGPASGLFLGGIFATIAVFLTQDQNIKKLSSEYLHSLPYQVQFIFPSIYITVILIGLRYYNYHKPIILYLAFAGYAGAISYQIAIEEPHKRVVPQIMILAFFTYWSSQLLFPAGMFNPDTVSYVMSVSDALESGHIRVGRYFGHLIHTTMFVITSGLSSQTGYYLLSVVLLVATIPLISSFDSVLSTVSTRTALFAALLFSLSSWVLRRGMHPSKLSFFYAIILITAVAVIQLFSKNIQSKRWVIIGIITGSAIYFGHRYSSGATMVFLIGITGFMIVRRLSGQLGLTITIGNIKIPAIFTTTYIIAVFGLPIHSTALSYRSSNIINSFFFSTSGSGGGGGGGRYSSLALDILFTSTFAQILLFGFATVGAVWMIRQSEWEYDLIIFWMGILGSFLFSSLLLNSADTQPQRFYLLLVIFGLNICAGVFLTVLSRWASQHGTDSINIRYIFIAILVVTFAVASFASPVADETTSPVADELPHGVKYNTYSKIASSQWISQHNSNILLTTGHGGLVPIRQISDKGGRLNLSLVPQGSFYRYSNVANRTGRVSGGGQSIGGRTRVFVYPPINTCDDTIYNNGRNVIFGHNPRCSGHSIR